MSYANGTQFYNLPQTVGNDKRDWFDTNAAFAAIDEALHAAVTGQAADAEAISTINTKLAADEADIAALQTASSNHATAISALQTAVNGQATQIADVRQDAEDMISAYNEGAAETSTHAYAIGDYFIYNDVLYKATAAIAIGDTIVPNTNCQATNVTTEIKEVQSDVSKNHKLVAEYINTTSKTNLECFNEILSQLAAAGLDEEQLSDARLILGRTDATRNVARMGRFDTVAGTKIFVSDPYGTAKVVYTGSSNPASRSIIEHAVDGSTTDIGSATNSTRWAVYV